MIEWLFALLGLPPPETPKTLDQYAVVVGTMVAIFLVLLQALQRALFWFVSILLPENRDIRFDRAESTPIWRGGDEPHFWLASAWFVSREPLQPARSVHALVDVLSGSGAHVIAHCLWAVGTHPSESGRWSTEQTQIDIPADQLPVKLNYAFRDNPLPGRDGTREASAWELNTKAQAAFVIPPDARRMRITLRGIQTNRRFDFAIREIQPGSLDVEHMGRRKQLRALFARLLPPRFDRRQRWVW